MILFSLFKKYFFVVKRTLLLLPYLMFISCNTEERRLSYPEQVKLQGSKIQLKEMIYDPVDPIITDSILYFLNTPFAPKKYSFIDLKHRKVQHVGEHAGPNYLAPSFIISPSKVCNCLESFDPVSQKLKALWLDSLILGKVDYFTVANFEEFQLGKESNNDLFSVVRTARFLDDNEYLFSDHKLNNLISIYDSKLGKVNGAFEFPQEFLEGIQPDLRPHLGDNFFPILYVHSTSNLFFGFFRETNFFFIGSYKNGEIKEIYKSEMSMYPEFKFKDGQLIKGITTPVGYAFARVTSNYIFLLYTEKTINDFRKGGRIDIMSNKIHVYNWEGEFIENLELDKETGFFVVDEFNTLYSFVSEGDGVNLYQYEINLQN